MYSDKQIFDFLFEEDYYKISKFLKKEIDIELKNNLFLYDFEKLNQLVELIFQKGNSYCFTYLKNEYFKGNRLNKGMRLISSLSTTNCIKLLDKIEPILINDVVQSRDVKLSELVDSIHIENYEYLNFQIMLQVENDLSQERFEQFIDDIISNSIKLGFFYINPYKISVDDVYFSMVKKYIKPYLTGKSYKIYLFQPNNIKSDNNYYRFVDLKNSIIYKDIDIDIERINSFGLEVISRFSKDMEITTIEYITDNLMEYLNKIILPSYYIRTYVRKGLKSKLIINTDVIELFRHIPVTEDLLSDIFNKKTSKDCITKIYEQSNYKDLPNYIKSGKKLDSYSISTLIKETLKLLDAKEDISESFFINNPKIFGLKKFSYYSNFSEKDLFLNYPEYFTQERLLNILYGISRLEVDGFRLCVKHVYGYFTEYNPEDILIRFGVEGIGISSLCKIYGKYVYNEKEFKFSKEVAKQMGMVFLSEDY